MDLPELKITIIIEIFSDIAKEKTLEQITEFDMSKLKVSEAAKEVETEKPVELVEEETSSEEEESD